MRHFISIDILSFKPQAKKKTLHANLAQSIHNKCRSKQLIQILNNLGMCVSYDEMLRMDYNLDNRLIVLQHFDHSCLYG